MLTNSVNSFTGAFPMSMAGHFVPILLLQKWVWQLWATNTIYVWFSKVVFFYFLSSANTRIDSQDAIFIEWVVHSLTKRQLLHDLNVMLFPAEYEVRYRLTRNTHFTEAHMFYLLFQLLYPGGRGLRWLGRNYSY